MRRRVRETATGGTTIYWEYTDTELMAAWHAKSGQGHQEAMRRGISCVVTECSIQEALRLTRWFVRRFACPTCCTYDGETLSMDCSQAGGNAHELHKQVSAYIVGFLAAKELKKEAMLEAEQLLTLKELKERALHE